MAEGGGGGEVSTALELLCLVFWSAVFGWLGWRAGYRAARADVERAAAERGHCGEEGEP